MMKSSANLETVDGFFQSYRSAFEAFDAPAIADHFAYPAHITSDNDEIVLMVASSREQWAQQIQRLLDVYTGIGVKSAHVLEQAVADLSPRLHQVKLRWALHDAADDMLYDFEAMYMLANLEGVLQITALAHNEQPRLRDCLARLGLHRPGREGPRSSGP
ncbi:MAG: hypothetical protein H0V49_01660 [Nocardioidaceae bacterium]|nr:hypothetical protein [Nocardioidaceae bacterium]